MSVVPSAAALLLATVAATAASAATLAATHQGKDGSTPLEHAQHAGQEIKELFRLKARPAAVSPSAPEMAGAAAGAASKGVKDAAGEVSSGFKAAS